MSGSLRPPSTATTTATTTTTNDSLPSSSSPTVNHSTARSNADNFYSGRNPVPRIQSYWELYPGNSTPPPSPLPEDLNSRERDRQRKIHQHTKTVKDPITGKRIKICDAKYSPPLEAPKHSKETYPPEQWPLFLDQLRSLSVKYAAFMAGTFILLNGCLGLPYSVSILVTFASGVTWWRSIDSAWDGFLHTVESEHGKQRMHTPGIPGNESVEWLNGIIAKLWPQINPDLFTPMVDLVEDVMQASIPSIVTQAKVANVGQGVVPIRVLSMRWLGEENKVELDPLDTKHGATDRLNEEEQVGEWASLEITFSYRAQPSSSSARSKAKNANLLVNFFMGMNGLFGTPVPVWVELRGVTGTLRAKVQLVPNPPFVKLATFTLLGMPKIEIAAVPMNQRFFNVMNLPILSDFINSSIKAAARQFIAPSNYTIDLSKILTGDDTKRELVAIGVFVVNIKSALGVMAADVNGKSDCYVTLSYSKSGKPLWSTRIIFSDLNPVWDETAMLLLDTSDVKAAEKLTLSLYDADRWTADDVLGKTEIDVGQLIRSPGKIWEREDNLKGMKEGSEMPGTVKWSVVYYGTRPLNNRLESTGEDERMPEDLKHPDTGTETENEVSVINTPPDPKYPSGILSIQIHNIVGLERHIISGSKGTPAAQSSKSQATEEEEEGHNLPSAYCSIILDYQKIYATRVKPMTSKPFFNCGTERFVRDWTKTKIMVVVRDSRLREEDPILGVISLNLSEVFTNCSQTSRFYPIRGGIGYGKVCISLLFRSIDAQLPRNLLACDVGSVEIVSKHISCLEITDPEVRGIASIDFATPLIRKKAVRVNDGWAPVHNTHGSTGFRLGVRHRHSAPCILYFRRESKVRKNKTIAVALFWLKDLPDDEDVPLTLPVFRPDNLDRFVQNFGLGEGKQVGEIRLVVRMHRGIGHSHRRSAQKEKNFKEVIQAVECVEHIRGEGASATADLDPTTLVWDEGSESEGSVSEECTPRGHRRRESSYSAFSSVLSVDSLRPLGDIKRRMSKMSEDRKEMHRMERGMMQWKGARTLAWVGSGLKQKGRGIKDAMNMEPRRPGVETEV